MASYRSSFICSVLFVLAAAVTASAQAPAGLPADINPDSLARLPYLQRNSLDEAGQKIYDVLPGRTQQGSLGGPLAFAAYSPAVAKALFDLHNAAVAGSLNAHVRELSILVACRETNYDLEWNAHEPSAVRAGVDAKVIDIVRRNAPLTGVPEADAVVIRFGRQMFTDRKVDSATFAKVVELYGQKGAMDIVAVMQTYAVSGFYAIAVDEHMRPGRPTLPPLK
jgi:4-carboxymuconolactone decarboxylase